MKTPIAFHEYVPADPVWLDSARTVLHVYERGRVLYTLPSGLLAIINASSWRAWRRKRCAVARPHHLALSEALARALAQLEGHRREQDPPLYKKRIAFPLSPETFTLMENMWASMLASEADYDLSTGGARYTLALAHLWRLVYPDPALPQAPACGGEAV